MSHIPVLLHQTIALLDPREGDFVIDATVDGGGHSAEIVKKIGKKGRLLGVDLDASLLSLAEEKIRAAFPGEKKDYEKQVSLVCGNYTDIGDLIQSRGFPKANAILADLGFSSEHLESSGRGFSFLKDEPLLMNYGNVESTARDVIKRLPEKEIARIIYEYGGDRFSRRIAKAIVERRKKKPILTSLDLAEVVRGAVSKHYERGRIHPATRTFQALRIYINDELTNLDRFITSLPDIVAPGGRVAIISFHSLEDSIVKKRFRTFSREKRVDLITKKPVSASREEVMRHPESRSAKIRAFVMRESTTNVIK